MRYLMVLAATLAACTVPPNVPPKAASIIEAPLQPATELPKENETKVVKPAVVKPKPAPAPAPAAALPSPSCAETHSVDVKEAIHRKLDCLLERGN